MRSQRQPLQQQLRRRCAVDVLINYQVSASARSSIMLSQRFGKARLNCHRTHTHTHTHCNECNIRSRCARVRKIHKYSNCAKRKHPPSPRKTTTTVPIRTKTTPPPPSPNTAVHVILSSCHRQRRTGATASSRNSSFATARLCRHISSMHTRPRPFSSL